MKVLLNLPTDLPTKKRLENDRVWVVSGVLMFLFTATYRIFVDAYNIFLWGGVCVLIGLVALVVGLRKRMHYV